MTNCTRTYGIYRSTSFQVWLLLCSSLSGIKHLHENCTVRNVIQGLLNDDVISLVDLLLRYHTRITRSVFVSILLMAYSCAMCRTRGIKFRNSMSQGKLIQLHRQKIHLLRVYSSSSEFEAPVFPNFL